MKTKCSKIVKVGQQRALGVWWNSDDDSISFEMEIQSQVLKIIMNCHVHVPSSSKNIWNEWLSSLVKPAKYKWYQSSKLSFSSYTEDWVDHFLCWKRKSVFGIFNNNTRKNWNFICNGKDTSCTSEAPVYTKSFRRSCWVPNFQRDIILPIASGSHHNVAGNVLNNIRKKNTKFLKFWLNDPNFLLNLQKSWAVQN